MENLKTFDGLPLNTEDALSNMENFWARHSFL